MDSKSGKPEASSLQTPNFFDTRLAETLLAALLFLSTLFAVASFLLHLYRLWVLDSSEIDSLIAFLGVNSEASLPTWFSSKLLFIAALLLGFLFLNTRHARPLDSRKWAGLAVIFLYLSADEATVIHERVGGLFASRFALSGVFYYAWVLPFALLVLVFLAVYTPFFLRLPGRTRGFVASAGTLYLGGAMGAEIAGALIEQSVGRGTLVFVGTFTLEEWLEMAGISLFIFALLDYTARYLQGAVASGQAVRAREEILKRSGNPS